MAISRRKALKTLGAVPVAAGLTLTPSAEAGQQPEQAHMPAHHPAPQAKTTRAPGAPQFFTPHEWATVKVLADLIIPKDERSGSATDAGVPAFIDFMMIDQPSRQTAMRGGLRWLDAHCTDAFGKTFVECAPDQRTSVLDAIAWPAKAAPNVSQGVAFFNTFRDLTASGFWSSRMGVNDLQYMGNVPTQWNGCPAEALQKLGLPGNV